MSEQPHPLEKPQHQAGPGQDRRLAGAYQLFRLQKQDVIHAAIFLLRSEDQVRKTWHRLVEYGETAQTTSNGHLLSLNLLPNLWAALNSVPTALCRPLADQLSRTTLSHPQTSQARGEPQSDPLNLDIWASETLRPFRAGPDLQQDDQRPQPSLTEPPSTPQTSYRGRIRAKSQGELSKRYLCPVGPDHCRHPPFARLQNCKNHVEREHKWYTSAHPLWEDNIRITNVSKCHESASSGPVPGNPLKPGCGGNEDQLFLARGKHRELDAKSDQVTSRRRSVPDIKIGTFPTIGDNAATANPFAAEWSTVTPQSAHEGQDTSQTQPRDPCNPDSYAIIQHLNLEALHEGYQPRPAPQLRRKQTSEWLQLTATPGESTSDSTASSCSRGRQP